MRLVEYSSPTQTLRAFRNGSVEAATLTLDEALVLAEDVPDLRIVLVMDRSQGADVVLGRPQIARLIDLRGRRVGYEAAAMGAYMLSHALDTAGLQATEITVVPVQVDEHEKVFTNGLVDAIVTFEPVRSRLLSIGARELFSSAQIPGGIIDVLVVRSIYLQEHSEQVDALLRGWFKALDYIRRTPDEAFSRLSKRLRLTPTQTREAYRMMVLPDLVESRSWLAGDPPRLRSVADRLGVTMLRHQLLRRPPDASQLINAHPLERVGQTQ